MASELDYFLAKSIYHRVSDGHLCFSIFSRPLGHHSTRVQRRTCYFVLFSVWMFLNMMYYDVSNEVKAKKSSNSFSLTFGSLSISLEQVSIHLSFVLILKRKINDFKLALVSLWRFSPSFLVFSLFNSFDVFDRVISIFLHYNKLLPKWALLLLRCTPTRNLAASFR
jgi:hypothetical protein